MTNHPNRAARRTIRVLSTATRVMADDYVEWVFAECIGEDETWPLGEAWRASDGDFERAHIAAALVYRSDALSDAPYRILGERGPFADERLCAIADDLRFA